MTTTYTQRLRKIKAFIKKRFKGKLYAGTHEPNGRACILEAYSQMLEKPWSDSRENCIDIRHLNDIGVDVATRAEWMPRVLAAWEDSLDWPKANLDAAVEKLVIGVVNELIAELPYLPDDIRVKCRQAKTLLEAGVAATSAASAANAANTVSAASAASAANTARAAKNAAIAAIAANTAIAASAAIAANAASAASAAIAARIAARAARNAEIKRLFIVACKLWIAAGKADAE